MSYISFIPGPWFVERVERPDADFLYNAVRINSLLEHVECHFVPTHSREVATLRASDLNRRYHELSGTGVLEPIRKQV